MFHDLTKYPWVLQLMEYGNIDELNDGFQKGIIDRAIEADKRLYIEKNIPNPDNLNIMDFN